MTAALGPLLLFYHRFLCYICCCQQRTQSVFMALGQLLESDTFQRLYLFC